MWFEMSFVIKNIICLIGQEFNKKTASLKNKKFFADRG